MRPMGLACLEGWIGRGTSLFTLLDGVSNDSFPCSGGESALGGCDTVVWASWVSGPLVVQGGWECSPEHGNNTLR